jgi:hypothetical protein
MKTLIAAIGIVASLGLFKQESKTPPAMQNAPAKMISSKNWVPPYYKWRSKDTLVIFEGNPLEQTLDNASIFNLRTHEAKPIAGFLEQWDALKDKTGEHLEGVLQWPSISPDGNWMACDSIRDLTGSISSDGWRFVPLLGGDWLYRAPDTFTLIAAPVWTRDSEHMVFISRTSYSIFEPFFGRKSITKPMDSRLKWPEPADEFKYRIGMTPDDRVVIIASQFGHHNNALILEFDALSSSRPPRQFSIARPPSDRIEDVVLSPNGRRLLWSTTINSDSQPSNELWVSNLDGSAMKKVAGPFEEPYDAKYRSGDSYRITPQWTPDGSHVSYLNGNSVYLLKVSP